MQVVLARRSGLNTRLENQAEADAITCHVWPSHSAGCQAGRTPVEKPKPILCATHRLIRHHENLKYRPNPGSACVHGRPNLVVQGATSADTASHLPLLRVWMSRLPSAAALTTRSSWAQTARQVTASWWPYRMWRGLLLQGQTGLAACLAPAALLLLPSNVPDDHHRIPAACRQSQTVLKTASSRTACRRTCICLSGCEHTS